MSTFKRVQGNSLWLDVTCELMDSIDSVWANWAGSYTVSKTPGSTVLVTGVMTRSLTPGLFNVRLGPVSGGAPWDDLPLGMYTLTTKVVNTTVDYEQEEHDKLNVYSL